MTGKMGTNRRENRPIYVWKYKQEYYKIKGGKYFKYAALRKEKTMTRTTKGILGLGIVLIGLNFYQLSLMKELSNRMDHQMNQYDNLRNTISNISSSVSGTMNSWKLENQWIRTANAELMSISEDLKQMEVRVFWQFNHLQKEEKVFLRVGKRILQDTKAEVVWEKYPIEDETDLVYQMDLTLPLQGSYIFEAVAESKEGIRSAELTEFNPYSMLAERIQVYGHTFSPDGKKLQLNIQVTNFIEDRGYFFREKVKITKDQLKLKTAVAEIFVNDHKVKTVDLIKEGRSSGADQQGEIVEESITYDSILEIQDVLRGDVSVRVKLEDQAGFIYEREVPLY
ncbi:hypothetical protein [Geosporobacter ferrireducens]|uniref:Uncharacterized protein n=1 Tax=Geosporobacter ferrireducens TaxID=1424294 RepID=A0A1D8GIQ6_9FIRM|nr:hypothetical protein [Geosporobacter ferrireducens]AOT70800.1 hypothetical protein Gferi_15280 [Geosporobacter ferrireducens]